MSQERFGEATRRAFLGTATVATAATLTAPVAGEAQTADTGHLVGKTKLAEANADVPAQLMSRAKAGDWTKPAAMAIPKEGGKSCRRTNLGSRPAVHSSARQPSRQQQR